MLDSQSLAFRMEAYHVFSHPDENHAREIMQLFRLDRASPDGNAVCGGVWNSNFFAQDVETSASSHDLSKFLFGSSEGFTIAQEVAVNGIFEVNRIYGDACPVPSKIASPAC